MAKTTKSQRMPPVKIQPSVRKDWMFPWPAHRFNWLLIILCILCYANTLNHGFVLDDDIVVAKNIYTQQGVRGIPDILSHDTFQGYFKGEQKNLVAGGRYRPLSLVLFAIEKSIIGDTPWIYHSIHLLLYILTVLLVFRFTVLALSGLYEEGLAKWIAALTAVIFAVHPIHTEVVANIKSSDEILSFLLGLASLYLLWKPTGLKSLAASMILFTLALFSKENAILWLPLGWLAFYFLDKNKVWEAFKRIAPLLLPALFFLLIRYWVLRQGVESASAMEWLNNPFLKIINNQYVHCTPGEKWGSIIYSLFYYFRLTLWPYPLTHDYYPNHFPLRTMGDPAVLLGLVVIVLALFMAWRFRATKPIVSFCILFFLVSLVLVANIFFPVGILFSERFAFTASYGICLLLAWWLAPYFKERHKAIILLTTGFVLGGIILTGVRNMAWKSNYTLFNTDIEHSPSSAKVNNALAGVLLARSETTPDSLTKMALYSRADRYLAKAVSIHPLYIEAWLLQGNSYFYQKRYDEAIYAFKKSLDIAPGYENSLTNLHLAYREAGKYWGEKMHNLEKALENLQQAYELNPNDFETLRLLGVAYGVAQNNVKAIEFLEKARAIKPENASVLYNLGSAYLNSGNPVKGQEFYDKARVVDSTMFN